MSSINVAISLNQSLAVLPLGGEELFPFILLYYVLPFMLLGGVFLALVAWLSEKWRDYLDREPRRRKRHVDE